MKKANGEWLITVSTKRLRPFAFWLAALCADVKLGITGSKTTNSDLKKYYEASDSKKRIGHWLRPPPCNFCHSARLGGGERIFLQGEKHHQGVDHQNPRVGRWREVRIFRHWQRDQAWRDDDARLG